MTDAATFQTTIAGVRVSTTHLYSKYLDFDRVINLVVRAMRSGVPNDEGEIEFRYTSAVRNTTPYRVVKFKPHWTPGQWLEVVDYPNGKHGGLITVEFENFYRFEVQPDIRKEKQSGVMYEVSPPKGYK